MCARYTANPLSNCVLGLSLGHTRTTVQALPALNVRCRTKAWKHDSLYLYLPYVFVRNSILPVIAISPCNQRYRKYMQRRQSAVSRIIELNFCYTIERYRTLAVCVVKKVTNWTAHTIQEIRIYYIILSISIMKFHSVCTCISFLEKRFICYGKIN